jgi:ribonuclease PH
MINLRDDGRTYDQVRPLKITFDPFGYADSSILFEQGGTKVLVGVSLQEKVPQFLRNKSTGWLTAEYSLLPISTRGRTRRDISQARPNGRNVEISRIIGRSLRSVIDLSVIGERTIVVDCDVLQADGGTRCASITAACIALQVASRRWLKNGLIEKNFIIDAIAAISVGIVDGKVYLDLSQFEDNRAEADFNFVLSRLGGVIEIQGTSEKHPISWENFAQIKELALKGVVQIFESTEQKSEKNSRTKPIFSLGNRLQNQGS